MKTKRKYYTERKIYHGNNWIDVQIFPEFTGTRKTARGKKSRPTKAMQKRLNEDNKAKKCIRLANENFCENDYALHLTYRDSECPQTEEQIKKDIQNYLRRVKRIFKQKNLVLKYMWTAARGERSGRPHFHLIISGGVSRDVLEKVWGKGYVHTTLLRFGIEGIAGFATYFCGQDKILFRAWSCSKNLKRPETEQRHISASKVYDCVEEYENNSGFSEIEQMYPGYSVASIKASKNEVVGGAYIFARLYRTNGTYCDNQKNERMIC